MTRLFLIFIFLLSSCGSPIPKQTVRVGIDPTWAPLDFGMQTAYVNGFIEELLLEISKISNLQFERVTANSNLIYEEMQKGQYLVSISSKDRYDFNLAIYDFSQDIIKLGPVLILPTREKMKNLGEMKGKIVGAIDGDPAALSLQPYPNVIPRAVYKSVPELLSAVVLGEIDGAILDMIPAVQYVNDLFQGQLKIATKPLTSAGLRFIAMKPNKIIDQLDRELKQLEKKKILQKLLTKWGLSE